LEYDGEMRKGIAEVSKTGWVYILDRVTGEPLIGIEERPVPQELRQATARTQPYPIGDAVVPQSVDIQPEGYPPLVNGGRIFTPFFTEGAVMKPGTFGGTSWQPTSYDPETGHLHVCANDRMFLFRGGDIDNEIPPDGERYVGGTFGAIPYWGSGIFAAMDLSTNRIVWRQRWSDFCYSGSVTTAGGLIFTGRNDGRMVALDSSNGSQLWEFQTGAGLNAPASVFEHDGEQYLVAYSAGNLFVGSPRGDSVWLFSLSGRLDEVPEAGTPEPVTLEQGREPDIAAGRLVYQVTCSTCHGPDGEGGHAGGVPIDNARDAAAIAQVVIEGRNLMPAWSAALTADQIQDVAQFVAAGLPQ
jgi:quinohemoprotein ethanol dehydrogenase